MIIIIIIIILSLQFNHCNLPHKLVANQSKKIEHGNWAGDEIENELENEQFQDDRDQAGRQGGGNQLGRESTLCASHEADHDDIGVNGHNGNVEIGSVHVMTRRKSNFYSILTNISAFPCLGAEGEEETPHLADHILIGDLEVLLKAIPQSRSFGLVGVKLTLHNIGSMI